MPESALTSNISSHGAARPMARLVPAAHDFERACRARSPRARFRPVRLELRVRWPFIAAAGWGTACGPHAHACGPVRRRPTACGNTLPGLSRPCPSKAHFSRSCCARSVSVNIAASARPSSRRRRRARPTDAALRHAQAQDIGAEGLGVLQFARLHHVEHDARMQIAVAGMEHVAEAEAVARRPSRPWRPAPRAARGAGWCRPCTACRA